MRFSRNTSKEIILNTAQSKRRLAAAKRALQRERDKYPLFADEIARNQPTPEERIEMLNQESIRRVARMRKFRAEMWRKGRKMLKELSENEQKRFLDYWNNEWRGPRTGTYLCDLVRHWDGYSARDESC